MKMYEIKGSEKQIAWAKDILSKPYKRLESIAKSCENIGDLKTAAFARKAMAEYEEKINKVALTEAREIIDHRNRFMPAAKNIIRQMLAAGEDGGHMSLPEWIGNMGD